MFDRFLAALRPDPGGHADPVALPARFETAGFGALMSLYAGRSFEGGAYRLHGWETADGAQVRVAEAFPEFAGRLLCFGSDWLGREFALDGDRRSPGGEPLVLMFEPGTGWALDIPATFDAFHDDVLVDEADAAIALSYFRAWAAATQAVLPVRPSQCVGYRIPLFLGGVDDISNLEVTDLEVYWSISGQLRLQTMDLPVGTKMDVTTIE